MKYKIHPKKSYRKQYKLLEKRGYDMSLLDDVVNLVLSETGTHSDILE